MGDEHEGGLRLVGELAEEAEDVFAVGGIEIAGGLIGQNERGAVDEGAGDGDALLFAAGKLGGQGGGARGKADAREGGGDAGGALGSGDAGELERELDVFGGGERGEQMENWNTVPTRSRRRRASPSLGSASMRSPWRAMVPVSGRSTPPRQLRSVVLPLPEGPVSAMRSPAATENDTSASTARVP